MTVPAPDMPVLTVRGPSKAYGHGVGGEGGDLDLRPCGLDVSVPARLRDLLRDLQRRMGPSAIVVTNDIGVVRLLADRLMAIKDGPVVEARLTDRVLDRPQDAHTQCPLASALPS